MVCPRCTLLHPVETSICTQCGTRLRAPIQALSSVVAANAPTSIGVVAGVSLLSCLAVSLAIPPLASAALSLGAIFGILSISNIWLSVYRQEYGDILRSFRGIGYSLALIGSLAAELARLQHLQTLPLLGGAMVAVPSAVTTELLAALLVVLDPLVIRPCVHWIELGVERGGQEAGSILEP
jgi:hypothetical protein